MKDERNQITQAEFVEITKKYIDPSEITHIMEIGALDGKDSVYLKSQFRHANVYCIEALKDNFEQYVCKLKDIVPINIVVTDYDGKISFHQKRTNGIHSIYDRGQEYGTTLHTDVDCKRLDTICKDFKIPQLDMVKIDVEGATYEVLNGMGELLKTLKIMHIETESYPFFKNQKLHHEVSDFLIKNDFVMIDMTSAKIAEGEQHDSIWIKKHYTNEKGLVS